MVDIVDFEATETSIDGLFQIRMKQVTDDRGTVREFFRSSAFAEAGIALPGPFPQVNVTQTSHGALRGMHAESMVKVIAIAAGEAFGAWVDLRKDSPTYGNVHTATLQPGTQIVVPEGVGNGFQSVSLEPTQYVYCFTKEWVPGMAGSAVNPLDPALGIAWPLPINTNDPSQISAKDVAAPNFGDE